MKTAVIATDRSAAADFLALTKPRLSSVVLVVVFLSAWLAGPPSLLVVLAAVIGTGLVAGGANALNMLLEREHDARMRRTWNRPLPAGRLTPREVLVFGLSLGLLGVILLAAGTTLLAAGIAAFNLICYVAIYTPLKRLTTLNTHIGAIPGALPALIGWAAVSGSLAPAAWALFLLVYVWQIPHFLSIAWIHRDDYKAGGFKMLPIVDPDGVITGRQAVLGAMALLPVSMLPVLYGIAGVPYLVCALALGGFFLARSIGFAMDRTQDSAKRLMRASLVYLPMVLFALLIA